MVKICWRFSGTIFLETPVSVKYLKPEHHFHTTHDMTPEIVLMVRLMRDMFDLDQPHTENKMQVTVDLEQ